MHSVWNVMPLLTVALPVGPAAVFELKPVLDAGPGTGVGLGAGLGLVLQVLGTTGCGPTCTGFG